VLPSLGLVTTDSLLPSAVLIPAAGGGAALPPVLEAGPGQWAPFMLASWAGGAVLFLTLQWLAYRAFLSRLGADARPARPPFYEGIATFVSRVVEGPVALGLVRRLIVIPADFSRRYSPAERRLAMAHERAHHRRGDLWWNAAALLFLAVNWFNPVAWLAFRAFRTDQELACDAAVAAGASVDERCDYARALVKAATRPGLVAACSMSDTGDLKRRLRMIPSHRASRLRSAGGIAAVALVALAGFAVGGARPVAPTVAAVQTAARTAAARPVHAAAFARSEVRQEDDAVQEPRRQAGWALRPAVHLAAAEATAAVEEPAAAPAPEPNIAAAIAHESNRRPLARPFRLVVAHSPQAWLEGLDSAQRQQVEAAIARAVAARQAQSGGADFLHFAVADGGSDADGQPIVTFRIRVENHDQGE
jgi:hypothetical protein